MFHVQSSIELLHALNHFFHFFIHVITTRRQKAMHLRQE